MIIFAMKYIKKITEGVSDRFLNNHFPYIETDFDDFNKKYNEMEIKKDKLDVIYKKDKWQLIKNPKSIKDFGKSCRGVILLNGDFYCETFSNGTIHNDILEILYELNILEGELKKNWGKKIPQESGFLTVQRFKDTDYIAIGESNRLIYNENDWNELISNYDIVLNKAKEKNPNINFSNKLVGVKYMDLKTTSKNTIVENLYIDQHNLIRTFLKNNNIKYDN